MALAPNLTLLNFWLCFCKCTQKQSNNNRINCVCAMCEILLRSPDFSCLHACCSFWYYFMHENHSHRHNLQADTMTTNLQLKSDQKIILYLNPSCFFSSFRAKPRYNPISDHQWDSVCVCFRVKFAVFVVERYVLLCVQYLGVQANISPELDYDK